MYFRCNCYFAADGRATTVAASSDSVPSAEADEEGLESEMMEESTRDRTVNEVWMDFDVLCRCFRLYCELYYSVM